MSPRLRPLAALAALALVSACGSQVAEERDAMVSVLDDVWAGVLTDAPPTPPQPSYAEVLEIPYATLSLRLDRHDAPDAPPVLLAAAVVTEGRVWYLDAGRRGIAMQGGRIIGSRGLARDVLGAPIAPGDPVVAQAPAADWPAEGRVLQRYRDGLGQEHVRAFECRYAALGEEEVELYQIRRVLTRMQERCANARGAFVNDYWIEPDTGRVMRARQWLGADTGWASVAVIRPFEG